MVSIYCMNTKITSSYDDDDGDDDGMEVVVMMITCISFHTSLYHNVIDETYID